MLSPLYHWTATLCHAMTQAGVICALLQSTHAAGQAERSANTASVVFELQRKASVCTVAPCRRSLVLWRRILERSAACIKLAVVCGEPLQKHIAFCYVHAAVLTSSRRSAAVLLSSSLYLCPSGTRIAKLGVAKGHRSISCFDACNDRWTRRQSGC